MAVVVTPAVLVRPVLTPPGTAPGRGAAEVRGREEEVLLVLVVVWARAQTFSVTATVSVLLTEVVTPAVQVGAPAAPSSTAPIGPTLRDRSHGWHQLGGISRSRRQSRETNILVVAAAVSGLGTPRE